MRNLPPPDPFDDKAGRALDHIIATAGYSLRALAHGFARNLGAHWRGSAPSILPTRADLHAAAATIERAALLLTHAGWGEV